MTKLSHDVQVDHIIKKRITSLTHRFQEIDASGHGFRFSERGSGVSELAGARFREQNIGNPGLLKS